MRGLKLGVVVTFFGGRSQCENFIPEGRDLSDSEIQFILRTSAGDGKFWINSALSNEDRKVWEAKYWYDSRQILDRIAAAS